MLKKHQEIIVMELICSRQCRRYKLELVPCLSDSPGQGMNSALGKKKMDGGKEAEILRVSQSVSCAYISLVASQMLFWAIDSSLDPVGKLKPLSWETQREEEHRIAWHNTVMDRPSPCSQQHRGKHPADAPAHLHPGPRHQPESFCPVLSRLMTKKKKKGSTAFKWNPEGGWFQRTMSQLLIGFFLFSFLTALTIVDSLTDLISVWISHSDTEIKNLEIKSFKQWTDTKRCNNTRPVDIDGIHQRRIFPFYKSFTPTQNDNASKSAADDLVWHVWSSRPWLFARECF